MTKNKLITIRIEESKRNAFRQWAKNHQIDGATFLYKIIDKCLSNQLSPDIIKSDIEDTSTLMNIQLSIRNLEQQFERRAIEQDSKMATLEREIDYLKTTLSTQNISKKPDLEHEALEHEADDLLNDYQLADILGVSPTAVNRWRHGQRQPSGKHRHLFDHYQVIHQKWRKIKN